MHKEPVRKSKQKGKTGTWQEQVWMRRVSFNKATEGIPVSEPGWSTALEMHALEHGICLCMNMQ